MRALVREAGVVQLVEVPRPELGAPDEVLVQVLAAGICRTDLHVATGAIPAADPVTLGHELGGRVLACGPAATNVATGDLVTADPALPGGFLGVTHHGVFADFVVLPAAQLYRVPAALGPRRAAYVEPVAAALAVLAALDDPGSAGARSEAERRGGSIDGRPCRGRGVLLGDSRFARLVHAVLDAHGLRDVVRLLDGQRAGSTPATFDFAIETAGTEAELASLIELVRPGGTIVLKSRGPARVGISIRDLVEKELTLRAVRYGSFDRAIALLASGALVIDDLLGDAFPLERYREAFERGESHKLFFAMDDVTCAA